ncbi:unnamed protein product [Ilex paraguariensis]|uniref:Uncharacterized protein n=1 Tax=Ilex paraguariensis TaxID=185542 RepID=A0ABC8USN6_9AQUA
MQRLTMTDDKNSSEEWVISIRKAGAANMSKNFQTRKQHMRMVPEILQANKGFQKYFVPRVVSIGPYHHGNPMLQQVENLKPVIANMYVSDKVEILQELPAKILERISEVRDCYDEGSIQNYNDESLAQMMILDGCFVLFYIRCVHYSNEDDLGMKSVYIALAQQDLFLLENQLPYFVLKDLMDERILKKKDWMTVMRSFIGMNRVTKKERGREQEEEEEEEEEDVGVSHLLELLRKRMVDYQDSDILQFNRYTYRNIKELMAVGIQIKPSDSGSLTGIRFHSHGSYATMALPAIIVNNSTKSKFLNLIADEMSSDEPNELWVTSYVCFLSKLISHPDDVKMLSSAKILDNFLGSDDEVSNLFQEIGGDLVPNPCAYADVRYDIQLYYNETLSSWLTQFRRYKTKVYRSQLMDDYFKNPWSILALGGAILALFFTGVQAYFQIWSSPSECEGLCNYIKTTHRI